MVYCIMSYTVSIAFVQNIPANYLWTFCMLLANECEPQILPPPYYIMRHHSNSLVGLAYTTISYALIFLNLKIFKIQNVGVVKVLHKIHVHLQLQSN